eukprot:2880509-Prorocentrum_lima.AAC.1
MCIRDRPSRRRLQPSEICRRTSRRRSAVWVAVCCYRAQAAPLLVVVSWTAHGWGWRSVAL